MALATITLAYLLTASQFNQLSQVNDHELRRSIPDLSTLLANLTSLQVVDSKSSSGELSLVQENAHLSTMIDISSFTSVSREVALKLIEDWSAANDTLTNAGLADAAQRALIIELIPEISADLMFRWEIDQIGEAEALTASVLNRSGQSITFDVRGLQLYDTVRSIIYSDQNYAEFLIPMVRSSAVADALFPVIQSKKSLDGMVVALSFPGIMFDNGRLITVTNAE
ncbi:MAG: hypothetical protein AAGJ94_02450 [Pseudomonadota bacterium]